jgi:hypothetical protein
MVECSARIIGPIPRRVVLDGNKFSTALEFGDGISSEPKRQILPI